jgi:hypothetical protein
MTIQQPESLDNSIFNKLWGMAALLATIFVIPVTLWGDKSPWLIAIPVVICVGWALYVELIPGRFQKELRVEAPVTALPSEFQGLLKHRKTLGLYVETAKMPAGLQMDFFGETEAGGKPPKKVILLKDEHGRQFVLVECDRFMAKVNSVIADDVKRAAEHAFKTGWKRLEKLAEKYPELGQILEDPLVLDAVKSDFQSNVSICMAKSGDIAAQQFVDETSAAAPPTVQYRITPEKPKHSKAHRSNS